MSFWRTSQVCLLQELEKYSETWPRSGSMRSGTCSAQKPSVPRTAVSGSTFSRGEYPTPTAEPYGTSQNEGKVPHQRPTAGTPSLQTWARSWPTPTYGDGKSAGSRCKGEGSTAHPGTSLTDAVKRGVMWTTPKATYSGPDYARSDRERSGGDDLVTQTAKWPTPTTRDHKGSCPYHEGGPDLPSTVSRFSHPDPTTAKPGPRCSTSSPDSPPVSHLNPAFVEWLMGVPVGLTALTGSEPLETGWSHWLQRMRSALWSLV